MENTSVVNKSEEEDLTGTYLGHPAAHTAQQIIYWIELILIVILNLIVITLIMRRRKKSWMLFYVMHLAISDLTVGIFYLFHLCLSKAIGWHGSEGLCKLIKYLAYVSLYASSAMIVIISIDRLYALSCPINAANRRKRYRYITVITGWLISFVVALPIPILGARLSVTGNETICDFYYETVLYRQMFTTIFTMFVLFIPAIIIIVCYMAIVIILWRKSRSRLTPSSKSSDGATIQLRTPNDSTILTRARKRSIEMTFLVVLAFTISWSPICFNYLLSTYGVIKNGGYYYIIRGLAPLNSVINPIVFLIFTRCMKTADHERSDTLKNHNRSSLLHTYITRSEHGNSA